MRKSHLTRSVRSQNGCSLSTIFAAALAAPSAVVVPDAALLAEPHRAFPERAFVISVRGKAQQIKQRRRSQTGRSLIAIS